MNFRITDDVSEHDVNEIHRMLNEYNLVHREKSKNPDRALFEDENSRKLAGLTGEIFGNWLCIQFLFVSEQLRGQGIGSKLLQAAKSEAKQRDCKYAFVDTFFFSSSDILQEAWISGGFHP